MGLLLRSTLLTVGGATLVGLLAALGAGYLASAPDANVARGSEDAFFVRGLHERELPPGGKPLRWTGAQASARFRRLPPAPTLLSVEVQGHQAPVRVVVGGSIVGTIATGARAGEWPIALRGGNVDVGLDVTPFRAGDGRHLGTQLRHIRLAPLARRPFLPLFALFLPAALALALTARAGGCGAQTSLALTATLLALAVALLAQCGVLYSRYAEQVLIALVLIGAAAAVFARLVTRRVDGAAPFAFSAALAAGWVYLVLAPSSLMIVSDAVFQAHMLGRVAQGDLFPTSVTQHASPFRIPYGISFFALLVPLTRMGIDPLMLVRWGAALAGYIGSLAIFGMLAPRSPRRATAAVFALLLLPGTFLVFSQGNLPNVFGQALTVLFLAWWAGGASGGWGSGALLFALAGLGHLSSAIVLAALAVLLAIVGRQDLREQRWRRGLALAAGAGVVALYYASFARMIVAQIPRLLGGAGQGTAPDLRSIVTTQLEGIAWTWLGLPAVILAAIGWRALEGDRLARTVKAAVLAGAALLLAAVVTPIEVRYLYALTAPVALLAALGAARLWAHGLGPRILAGVLVGLQLALGAATMVERLFSHYR